MPVLQEPVFLQTAAGRGSRDAPRGPSKPPGSETRRLSVLPGGRGSVVSLLRWEAPRRGRRLLTWRLRPAAHD